MDTNQIVGGIVEQYSSQLNKFFGQRQNSLRYNCVSWWEVFMRLSHQVGKCKYYRTAEQRSDSSWMWAELQRRFQKRAFYCTENDNKELWKETETHPFQPLLWVDSNIRLWVLVSQRSLNSSLLFPMSGGGGDPQSSTTIWQSLLEDD